MFKNKITYLILTGAVALGTLSSCNDFLDVVPDNRTEIDSKVKAQELLVSAYPQTCFAEMGEIMSDNVTDNGTRFEVAARTVEECYYWNNVSEQGQDTPYMIWNGCYGAIAATNEVLEYVKNATDPDLLALKGEALIARAYSHFFLVNVFSQHYNKETSSTDLGIPYIDNPNSSIEDVPSRGTVAEVYEKINQDIENGLKLVNDQIYSGDNIAKYHFNKRASYAFATRFNLYYGEYAKAIQYATVALGTDPSSILRNYKDYTKMASSDDMSKTWTRSDRDNNFILFPVHSLWALSHKVSNARYAHNRSKCSETIWAEGPWGSANDNTYLAKMTYGSNEGVFVPKYYHYFEVKDVVSQSGYWKLVHPEFTADETLLCRAEAYVMLNRFEEATADLKIWAKNYTLDGTPELTSASIESFFSAKGIPTMRPKLSPKFAITEGTQTNFLHCILWFRRCETLHNGMRWFDIKRFGLEVTHKVTGAPDIVLKAHDLRKAVQIPEVVLSSGIQANPR